VRRVLPFAILGGCLAVGVLPALAADQSVAIHDFSFAPREVAVMPGESVTWHADGAQMHNVHFDTEPTPLGAPSATFTASRRFDTEGSFAYHCDVHGTMRGRVYVNQTGTVPTPAPTTSPTASPTAGASPTPSSSPGGGSGSPGATTPPVTSFRLKASVRKRRVFLTLTLGAGDPVRVRGTLRRGARRVRRVSLLAQPGRHRLRLPGKRLKPGRYRLTLKAGDIRRTVRFRVRL
jgi:plastocyanin